MAEVTIPDRLPIVIDRDRLAMICRRYGIRELALFGSVLRDDFTPTSDVDVLYELAPISPIRSLLDVAALVVDLEELFGRRVDLAEKNRLYPLIAPAILSSCQVIYAAAE
ncbi:MAG: nucleotidyltransferase domain-containing protein [Firmicutes bacterium]|nr:nucleotidyltransferase domain-containing protein [Bacillota bacterium]